MIVTFDNRLVLNKHDDDNDDDDDDDDDDYDDYDDKLVSVFQITSGKIFRFAVEWTAMEDERDEMTNCRKPGRR